MHRGEMDQRVSLNSGAKSVEVADVDLAMTVAILRGFHLVDDHELDLVPQGVGKRYFL